MPHHPIAELPKPGQERSYDRRTGIQRILGLLVGKTNSIQWIAIQCSAGNLAGRVENPQVVKNNDGYSVVGQTTATPGQSSEFRFYDNGLMPAGQELVTISSIFVKC